MASIEESIRAAILGRIPDAEVAVDPGASGGHFALRVTSPIFAGKSMLESQRLVLGAIAHLMSGDDAPVHAIDSLKTHAP